MRLVGEGATDRRGRVVADAESAAVAVVAIVLVVVQQPPLPLARELMAGDDRPVVPLDLPPELGDHVRHADRGRVPAVARVVELALAYRLMRGGNASAPILAQAR